MAKCHMIFPLCGCKPVPVFAEESTATHIGLPPDQLLVEGPDPALVEKYQEVEKLRAKIKRRRQRERFSLFFQEAWKATNPGTILEWGPHIQAVCDHVQWQLEDRAKAKVDHTYKLRAQNLVINVPPRSLKTKILTYATIWAWLRWPEMRIMYLSANPRVALNSARDARDLVISNWFQKTHEIDWTIRTDQNALSDLGNTRGGARIARGLDATITGEGAEWIIIDDPHDLRDSIENIEKCIEGYDSAVHNRINDPRAAIRTCIMQRVNIMDFTAHILKKDWVHVRIPMEYESKPMCTCKTCVAGVNPYGWKDHRTEEGEILHPRFTQEFLDGERMRLGPFGYAAQMQQRPAVAGGGRLKKEWWGFSRLSDVHAGDHPRPPGCTQDSEVRVIPKIEAGWNRGKYDLDWVVISVDAANKKTERGSAYGLLCVGGKDMRRFVLDDRTRRGEFNEILDVLKDMIVVWRPEKLLVEAKAAGPSLMSSLDGEMKDGKLIACRECKVGLLQDLHRVEEYWIAHCRECNQVLGGPGQQLPQRHEDCQEPVPQKPGLHMEAKVDAHWQGTCNKCGHKGAGDALTFAIESIEVDIDKERRVDAILPQIAARLVYLLEGAPWLAEFVEEHALFPESPWNDRVDALSQVLEYYKDGPFYVL